MNTYTIIKNMWKSSNNHIDHINTDGNRTPDRLVEYTATAKERGLKVIIAGAGMAAALPGAAAAMTPLPVLGVPMEGKVAGGLDAILSMVQMPAGIPVATVAIGKAGAKNAAYLAAQIMAVGDSELSKKVVDERAEASRAVIAKDSALQEKLSNRP